MSELWTPQQNLQIGNWTPAELRRFVVNTILNDPGALPKTNNSITASDLPKPVWGRQTYTGAAQNLSTAADAVSVTLSFTGRPVLVVANGGSISNTSGAAQAIRAAIYVDGAGAYGGLGSMFDGGSAISNGATLNLAGQAWLLTPDEVPSGLHKIGWRSTVGDGSASIKLIGSSIPFYFTVSELL